MNANYSEALEQQIALHRWATGQAVRSGFVEKVYGSTAWFHIAHQVLRTAEPYYVSAQVGQLLAVTSNSTPDLKPSLTLLPSNIPGFVWFERAIALPDLVTQTEKVSRRLRAFTWAVTLRGGNDSAPARWESASLANVEPTEIFIVPWISERDSRTPVPWSFFEWRWEETQTDAIQREQHEATTSERYLDARYARRVYDLCAAFWLFLQQRILSAPKHGLERHARRRVEREMWMNEPIVRVVELRRHERVTTAVESIGRDWSCQWLVRGHWRQQPYPKAGVIRPLWITPYVKGPEDKPLKPPRATVFAVVR